MVAENGQCCFSGLSKGLSEYLLNQNGVFSVVTAFLKAQESKLPTEISEIALDETQAQRDKPMCL